MIDDLNTNEALEKVILDYANGLRLHNEANKLLAAKLIEMGNGVNEMTKTVKDMSDDLRDCVKAVALAHKRLSEQEARIWKLEKANARQ